MSEPFVGEIRLFGFQRVPAGWFACNGQLLAINQFDVLFTVLETTYGGDGQSTFQLPNLMERAACNQGQGPGLTNRMIGQSFGEDVVTLSQAQMPQHSHGLTLFQQTDASKLSPTPANGNGVAFPRGTSAFASGASADAPFASTAIGNTGGSQAHENRQPYLAVNFCIALVGAYPTFG